MISNRRNFIKTTAAGILEVAFGNSTNATLIEKPRNYGLELINQVGK